MLLLPVGLYVVKARAFERCRPWTAVSTHELQPMRPHVSLPVLPFDGLAAGGADALMLDLLIVGGSMLRCCGGGVILCILDVASGAEEGGFTRAKLRNCVKRSSAMNEGITYRA